VLADGTYRLECWETYRGNLLSAAEGRAQDGELTFELPPFNEPLQDIAVLIRPQEG
jgi:hypothetical protein